MNTTPIITCIIPVYNAGYKCIQVIEKTKPHVDHIIIIDDGSTDEASRILDTLTDDKKCQLIKHPHNLGKGHALVTGFKLAVQYGATHILTIDSDGQHDPNEIPHLLLQISNGSVLIIGTRDPACMPIRSRVGNVVTRLAIKIILQADIPDTQSGFRIYSANFISSVNLNSIVGKYETEMRLLIEAILRKGRISFAPIRTIYFDDNRISKFNPIADSIRIYKVLFSYTLTSILSFCVDYLIFITLLGTIFSTAVKAHIVARIVSILFNFSVNKYFVFCNRNNFILQCGLYAIAALFTLFNSSLLLWIATDGLLNLNPKCSKIAVDSLLFVGNYFMVKFIFSYDRRWLRKLRDSLE